MSKNTIMFEGFKDSQLNKKEALIEIYSALTDQVDAKATKADIIAAIEAK